MFTYREVTFAYRSFWCALIALIYVLVFRPLHYGEAVAYIWTLSGYVALRLRHEQLIFAAECARNEGASVYSWVILYCIISVVGGLLSLSILCLLIYTGLIWGTGDEQLNNPGNGFR